MHVALDVRMAGKSGVGRYVTELRRALEVMNIRVHPVTDRLNGSRSSLSTLFGLQSQIVIPLAARHSGAEILHVPHFNAPWFPGLPLVVTIHDVAYLDHPEWQLSPMHRAAYRALMWGAVTHSQAIITVSEFSKQRLCYHFKVAPEKVRVTYLAPTLSVKGNNLDPVVIRQQYARGSPFVLYVGNIRPHKNLPVLVKAFEKTRRRLDAHMRLLIVGDTKPGYREVNQLENEWVICLGWQPDDVVGALYRAATAFVFPSQYEGFGLPVLEAMAAGCPVVCSAAGSLPEVVGDSALTFPPEDVNSLSHHLEHVISDSNLSANLRRKGLARAETFRWERTARETAAVYEQVVNEMKG